MKIIRFVNGKKFSQEFSKEMVIENSVIINAIDKINSRLSKSENKDNANE